MSNSAFLSSASASSNGNPSEDCVTPARAQRGDRSAGKGRRRRAIAEQRHTEQQNWNHFLHDRDEEVYVAPPRPPLSRRQSRRAARRAAHEDWESGMLEEEDEDDIDMALALSLSLLEPGNGHQAVSLARLAANRPLDMSYESLVMLENVKCTAPPALVNSLTGHVFNKGANILSGKCVEELCTICQVEYKDGDSYMLLPCLHTFHDTCGSEWFLKHSKLCPMCKHDVTETV